MFKGSRQKCQYVPPVILQLEEENCKLCEETQFHLHLQAALVKRAIPFQFDTFIACAHLCRAAN